jgi:hypothetical protein
MTKLPEPEGRICFDGGDWEEDFVSSQDAYSEEQMLQFRRDALEEVAKYCESNQVWIFGGKRWFIPFNDMFGSIHQGMDYAAAIRKLGESL